MARGTGPGTFSVAGGGVVVGLGSLHGQPPLDPGQNLAVLVQESVPAVGALLQLGVPLVLETEDAVI